MRCPIMMADPADNKPMFEVHRGLPRLDTTDFFPPRTLHRPLVKVPPEQTQKANDDPNRDHSTKIDQGVEVVHCGSCIIDVSGNEGKTAK